MRPADTPNPTLWQRMWAWLEHHLPDLTNDLGDDE